MCAISCNINNDKFISAIEIKQEVKTEKKDMKPPPEKKSRIN